MKIVDIILLHYGDVAVTQQCINSIESSAKSYRRIIIINNDPLTNLKKTFKETSKRRIINGKKNVGFAAGVNIGIKQALIDKADYVCLLNNDVTIEKEFLKPVIEFLEQTKEAGVAGSVIKFYSGDKALFDHGATINPFNGKGKHSNNEKILIKKPKRVDYISGCCMVIKREVIEAIGYFDEQFFMYYEDVDFCLRAKEKGYMTYIIPNSIINHALSKSIGRHSRQLTYQLVKSNMRFSRKHSEFPLRYVANILQICTFGVTMPKHMPDIIQAIKEA